jgi:hypothetical protein
MTQPLVGVIQKTNYIDLKYGQFDRTNPGDLSNAFDTFVKSRTNHLCVFFHGGLVGRGSAMDQAEQLMPGYSTAGAYPFFFIWNSDLLTTLLGPSSRYADNPVFRRVVERHIVFIAGKMLQALDATDDPQHPLWALARLPRAPSPPPLSTLAAFGRIADSVWARRPEGITLIITPAEIRAFEQSLIRDLALDALEDWLDGTRFTEQVATDFLDRVRERFLTGHDHGLYTTLVEELLHVVKMDDLCAREWTKMKGFIDASFQPDPAKWGGTAFVQKLASVWTADMRLTLISHSAGAIYIDRMLNEINTLRPDIEADVIFIAAGISFERLARSIALFRSKFRFFALKDLYEGGYWEIPPVYDKSLLYFVSSLCESDINMDKELVGMQRYWSGVDPYRTKDIMAVTSVVTSAAQVWSATDRGAPACFCAHAYEHGGFAEEHDTDESVRCFLVKP